MSETYSPGGAWVPCGALLLVLWRLVHPCRLPLDWSALDKTPFKKLLVLRCMRPDRLNVALRDFIGSTLPLGSKFVDCDTSSNSVQVLEDSLKDSMPAVPLFFILSPGSDVVGDLDKVAKKQGFEKAVTYHNVSMGQGQDIVAMEKLEMGHKNGHWVILNNVRILCTLHSAGIHASQGTCRLSSPLPSRST